MPPSEDKRIRKGLKFLFKADSRAVKAAVQLEKVCGIRNPPAVREVLKRYRFTVAENHYAAKMTEEQHGYLVKKQGGLKEFADAIADLLLNLNHAVVHALDDLALGLGAPFARTKKSEMPIATPIGIVKSQLGCCQYDTNLESEGVTKPTCVVGLQGTWTAGPCDSALPPKDDE